MEQSAASAGTTPQWRYLRAIDLALGTFPSNRQDDRPTAARLGRFAAEAAADRRRIRFPRPPAFANVALRAPLAQLAEQLTLNQRVGGSIPSRRTFLLVRGTLALELGFSPTLYPQLSRETRPLVPGL